MKAVILLCVVSAAFAFPDASHGKGVKVEDFAGFLSPRLLEGQTPLIVGGSDATKGAYPHQISLQRFSGGSWYHSCGGSIVGADKIITAAHCVQGANINNLRVVAGDHNLSAEEGTEQVSDVRSATAHPNYNSGTIDYDYAVIRLTTPLNFNDNVQPIELAAAGSTPSGNCVNTGWGNTRGDGSVNNPAILQTVTIPYVPRNTCSQYYAGINTVTERMVCAGAASQGPCNGDSGGPLVCNGVLSGIVSWGMQPCAQSRYPGVYANVAAGRSWLDAQ